MDEYIYAKWALFQTAYPDATTRERERFYELAAEGTVNFYLRDQLRMYEGDDIDRFVLLAQKRAETERRRMERGDSWARDFRGIRTAAEREAWKKEDAARRKVRWIPARPRRMVARAEESVDEPDQVGHLETGT